MLTALLRKVLTLLLVQVAMAATVVTAAKVAKVVTVAKAVKVAAVAKAAAVTNIVTGSGGIPLLPFPWLLTEVIMTNFSLPTLNKSQQTRMLRYAEQVLQAQQQMTTAKGKNILHYTLEKKRKHIFMNHYPKGDRIDHETGAQYFYHCHREDMDSMEHGHFHCFLRYKGIPGTIKPMPLADWDKYMDNPMTHLVAIAMNCYGQPIRLFTVNRWVAAEIMYEAKHVQRFIKLFNMTLTDNPYWQTLDRWVSGMLQLFAPQIMWLHQERDHYLAQQQKTNLEQNAYENHAIEEPSQIAIDLQTQIQWLLSMINQNESATT